MDRETGHSRGFGFVEMATAEGADAGAAAVRDSRSPSPPGQVGSRRQGRIE